MGLRRKKKEKIKFPDAYVRGSFSPLYKAVGLPLEGGWAAVETMYRKRKVSSGAELGALCESHEKPRGEGGEYSVVRVGNVER